MNNELNVNAVESNVEPVVVERVETEASTVLPTVQEALAYFDRNEVSRWVDDHGREQVGTLVRVHIEESDGGWVVRGTREWALVPVEVVVPVTVEALATRLEQLEKQVETLVEETDLADKIDELESRIDDCAEERAVEETTDELSGRIDELERAMESDEKLTEDDVQRLIDDADYVTEDTVDSMIEKALDHAEFVKPDDQRDFVTTDAMETAIADAIETAMSDAEFVKEEDALSETRVESMIEDALGDYAKTDDAVSEGQVESMIEDALRGYVQTSDLPEAVRESSAVEALGERVEALETAQPEPAAEIVWLRSAGFVARLRWLLTGKF